VQRVANRALVDLVLGTPVDKGVARSNWRVSLGNPTRAQIRAYAPGRKLGIGERQNAAAAIAAGTQVIARLRASPRGDAAGQAVFITNAIPYLDKLRNGHSLQQPSDWVEAALLSARSIISQARLIDR